MIPRNIHETAASFGDLRRFAQFDASLKGNDKTSKKAPQSVCSAALL